MRRKRPARKTAKGIRRRRHSGRRRYRKGYTAGMLTRLARAGKATYRGGKLLFRGYRWIAFTYRGQKHEVVLTPKQQLSIGLRARTARHVWRSR